MKAVESPKNDFRRPTNELLAPFHFDGEENTSRDEDTQSRLRSSQGRVHVESEPVPAEDLTSCDLRGTEVDKNNTPFSELRRLPSVFNFSAPLNFMKGFLIYHDGFVPSLAPSHPPSVLFLCLVT